MSIVIFGGHTVWISECNGFDESMLGSVKILFLILINGWIYLLDSFCLFLTSTLYEDLMILARVL